MLILKLHSNFCRNKRVWLENGFDKIHPMTDLDSLSLSQSYILMTLTKYGQISLNLK